MNKKPPKKTSLKRRATSSTESVAKLKQTIAAQAQEIREGADRQNAASEILRLIARSPADVQSVMDTIAESAARLCDADDAVVRRRRWSFLCGISLWRDPDGLRDWS